MPLVSKEQFEEWKRENPVTLEFIKFLKEEAKARRFLIGSGGIIDRKKPLDQIGADVYKALTQAEIYELVCGIEYEDMYPEEGE
jgi:hypothetical protein